MDDRRRKTVGMVAQGHGDTNVPATHRILRAYKALSVRQPWASMIAGLVPGFEKAIETRTWPTTYRGDLVIVSSLKPDHPSLHWPKGEYYYGKALCICELVTCRPMTAHDCEQARCDLYDGAYAWVLANIRRIEPPIAVKGRLGIYECVIRT